MKGFIKIYDKGGKLLRLLPSRRIGASIKSASIETTLGSVDLLRLNVESVQPIDWQLGERAEVYGRSYRLNRLPSMKKDGGTLYSYQLEYEGRQYDLLRVLFDLTVDTTKDTAQDLMEIALTGTAHRFLEVLTANARRVYGSQSWQIGNVPEDTETKTLSFAETDNCLSVLQRLCKEWSLEFHLREEGGTVYIDLKREGEGERLYGSFAVGRGKGLYSLERQTQDSTSIVTRLKVYGSNENLPHRYRSTRLCLPSKSKALSYIEDSEAIERLGLWEATKVFEEIKPERTGTLSDVNEGNPLLVQDKEMFDLNAKNEHGTLYLMAGVTAKLHFITGSLAGYDFEIASYDHATRTFTLNPHEVKIGADTRPLPNETLRFKRGDQYKLVDVALPPEYAKSAEEELLRQGTEYLRQNAQPRLRYALTLSERALYLREHKGGAVRDLFRVGDYIHVVDSDMGVDGHIRISSITRDALNPYDYKLTLSEAVEYTLFQKMISQKVETEQVVKTLEVKSRERAERAHKQAEELRALVFDPEGNYYSEKIKPQSIETKHISIGARPEQMFVSGLLIEANKGGLSSRVANSSGLIEHLSIEDKPRRWTISEGASSLEHEDRPYYIYIEAPKQEGGEAVVFYSTEPLKVDAREGKYVFQIGVLHTPIDGIRGVTLTYGSTMINGRFITTGRIESADKGTYFDLDTGEIGGNIRFRGGKDLGQILDERLKPLEEDDYLKRAIKDNSTEIAGGLIATGIIATKDHEGKTTAYISGDTSRPFVRAGEFVVSGTTIPAVEIQHSGDARFGQLHIVAKTGVIHAREPNSGKAPFLTIGGELPTLEETLRWTPNLGGIAIAEGTKGFNISTLIGQRETIDRESRTVQTLTNLKSDTRLDLSEGQFTFEARMTGRGSARIIPLIFLMRTGTSTVVGYAYGGEARDVEAFRALSRRFRPLEVSYRGSSDDLPRQGDDELQIAPDHGEYQSARTTVFVPQEIGTGGYNGSLDLCVGALVDLVSYDDPTASVSVWVKYKGFTIRHSNEGSVMRSSFSTFTKDGMSLAFSNKRLFYISSKDREAFATIRGVTDFPGLLLSGRVSASGRLEYIWGARRALVSVEKLQRGIYKVTHHLGHTNYTISLAGENRYQDKAGYQNLRADSFEVWMSNGANDHFDYGFCFAIFGDNQ